MTDERCLHDTRHFTGTLSIGDNKVRISFDAKVDESGKVVLGLEEVPLNAQTAFILTSWDQNGCASYFRLSGTSSDGISFASEHVYFNSIGPHSNSQRGTYFVFSARCAKATFRYSSDNPAKHPLLLLWLNGFGSFGRLTAPSPMGRVAMTGDYKASNTDRISGWLAVQAEVPPESPVEWRAEAEKLLEHVRGVMSFAVGTNVSAPAVEFRHGSEVEVIVTSKSERHYSAIPNFHVLDRQGIFEAAVRSFHAPRFAVRNLWIALEWFSMPATYNEVRLVTAMTALENLVNSNVEDKFLLENALFGRLKKAIRNQVKQFIRENELDKPHPALLSELAEKLGELQRRSLKRKLKLLLEQWSVPLSGLDDEKISEAINARNLIVHEGRYYKEGTNQIALWEHVTVVRELFTRIILTALGFQGRYVSHLGGYHHAKFPPE